MSPERFKLVEEAFQAAVGLDPGARRAFVVGRYGHDTELCERVMALLERHDAGGVEPGAEFLKAVRGVAESALCDTSPRTPPTRIASYRILRPLGEGGFGMVYLAEQDRPRRTVALKLLRTAFASGEIARRFEYEARILARLRHPGIAQIYEAGAAEIRVSGAHGADVVMRQPFLALEYVEGPNLITFALGDGGARPAIPVRDRLALVAQVCDALQHAHQNGVIHRDLKPDNILVACDTPAEPAGAAGSRAEDPLRSAHPKLLDFGVARVMDADPDLTRAHTGAGRMIGTLAYMSPEQIAGDSESVDTRSDVYAMGVLLYQMLSGALPYDVSNVPLDQAVRVVREREPSPIRSLDRALRSDAHAVVQKAMAKDRERRYASMAEFGADIRRLLSGDPVGAKGDSRWYAVSKTVKRHRVALGVATAFVLVLVASSVVGWMLYVAAQRAHAHSASLLRESYLNQARAVRAGNGVGRRFGAMELLKKAAALRMGEDLRSEAVAALCVSDFRTLREFPMGVDGVGEGTGVAGLAGVGSARGLARLDRLALIGEDGAIRVVSVESGEDIRRIESRGAAPTRVRFSKSGEFLGALYAREGRTAVVIWSLGIAEPVIDRNVTRAPVEFAFGQSQGKPWVALPASGDDGKGGLELAALPSGERIASIDATGGASLICASDDGTRLALIAPGGKQLAIFDTSSGERLAAWTSECVLRSPCWSPDGGVIGACGDDSRVHLWDARKLERLPPLEGHRAVVAELALGRELAATSAWDGSVRVWDRRTRAEVFSPLLGTELLGFDGRRLAVADAEGVRVLELEDESPRLVLRAAGPLGAEATVDFCPGSPFMAVAGTCGVQLWDTRTWRSVTLADKDSRGVMFPRDDAGDGARTVVAIVDGELRRWDVHAAWESDAGRLEPEILWRGWRDAWASLHPDGRSVVVSDWDQLLRVDLESGAATRIAASSPATERPVIDASGRWLFFGTWRGAPAEVVDLHTAMTAWSSDEPSVRGAFSPDGTLLAVGLPGRHLVFETGRWESPRELKSRESALSTVAGASAIAPDASILGCVEPPHIVRLAAPRTAEVLMTLPNAERYGVPTLCFSPDGRFLVVPTLEETIMVWRLDELTDAMEKTGLGW